MTTYDDYLEARIRDYTDYEMPEWMEAYSDIYLKLPEAEDKAHAIMNIEMKIEELENAIEYLKELPEY